MFVLIYCLREFPLFAITNRFELRCQNDIVFQNPSLFLKKAYMIFGILESRDFFCAFMIILVMISSYVFSVIFMNSNRL